MCIRDRYKLIQQRPNKDVSFYSPSELSLSKINEYISAGKISGPLSSDTSSDSLVNTMSLTINDENYDEIINDTVFTSEVENRINYCNDNLISWSVETN